MKWVRMKVAATDANIHPRTLRRWALAGLVRARRLASGKGPWLFLVDADGYPVDAK